MGAKCFSLTQCIREGDLPVKVLYHRQKTSSLHYHDYPEMVIVLSGHGTHFYKEEKYTISRGDVFVVKPGIEHRYETRQALSIVNVLIDFSSRELCLNDLREVPGFYALFEVEPLLRERSNKSPLLRLSAEDLNTVSRYLKEIDAESRQRQPGWRFAALNSFSRLLLLVSRLYKQPQQKPTENMIRLSQMLQFIEKNYTRDISRDEIVGAACISSCSGSRIFKQLLGKSIVEYLTQIRTDHAREKLRQGLKVSDVAFQCGFRDSNYFSTVFRKATGESPSVWRKGNTEK